MSATTKAAQPLMVTCTRHGDNCSGYECSGLMELTRVHEEAAAKIRDTFPLKPTSQDIAEFLDATYSPLIARTLTQAEAAHELVRVGNAACDGMERILEVNKELLEALEAVIPYMESAEKAGLVGDEGCHWPVEFVRAAIAKARGRQL